MDSGFKVLDSELLVSGIWILLQSSVDSWFLELYPGFQSPGYRLPQQKKIAGFRSPQANISRIPKSGRTPLHGARELTVERQFVVLLDIAFRPL